MKKNRLFKILIIFATLFMSVGYASINNVILGINGLGSIAAEGSNVHISAATPLSGMLLLITLRVQC